MGLKKTNFVSNSTGQSLPTAYAVLKNLIIEKDDNVRAIFAIQTSRENATRYKPIDTATIWFKWDRKTDPAKMAYEFAKTETKLVEDIDGETGLAVSRVVLGTLYGWEDDIV
jgi:hypothetical protein